MSYRTQTIVCIIMTLLEICVSKGAKIGPKEYMYQNEDGDIWNYMSMYYNCSSDATFWFLNPTFLSGISCKRVGVSSEFGYQFMLPSKLLKYRTWTHSFNLTPLIPQNLWYQYEQKLLPIGLEISTELFKSSYCELHGCSESAYVLLRRGYSEISHHLIEIETDETTLRDDQGPIFQVRILLPVDRPIMRITLIFSTKLPKIYPEAWVNFMRPRLAIITPPDHVDPPIATHFRSGNDSYSLLVVLPETSPFNGPLSWLISGSIIRRDNEFILFHRSCNPICEPFPVEVGDRISVYQNVSTFAGSKSSNSTDIFISAICMPPSVSSQIDLICPHEGTSFAEGTKCKIHCIDQGTEWFFDGNVSDFVCDASGEWLRPTGSCMTVGSTCAPLNRGTWECDSGHEIGSTCSLRCDNELIPIGNDKRTCLQGGHWSGKEDYNCLLLEFVSPKLNDVLVSGTYFNIYWYSKASNINMDLYQVTNESMQRHLIRIVSNFTETSLLWLVPEIFVDHTDYVFRIWIDDHVFVDSDIFSVSSSVSNTVIITSTDGAGKLIAPVNNQTRLHVKAIVGSCVGIISLLVLIAIVAVLLIRQRKRNPFSGDDINTVGMISCNVGKDTYDTYDMHNSTDEICRPSETYAVPQCKEYDAHCYTTNEIIQPSVTYYMPQDKREDFSEYSRTQDSLSVYDHIEEYHVYANPLK